MHEDIPSLTLVYLMYNEAENIEASLDEGLRFLRANVGDWEVVVVDDGSTDGGASVVERIAATEPRVRLKRHAVNRGMGAGMATGIAECTKELFCFMPADGQVEAVELSKMLPLLKEADIVLSTYERRADTLRRRVMSRAFRLYLRALADVRFELEGLYLFPSALGRELLPRVSGDTFFFSFQLVLRAVERGATVATTTIVCKPRASGVSKVASPRRVARVAREVVEYRVRRR